MPSLKHWYGRLSEAIHEGREGRQEDHQLFEEAITSSQIEGAATTRRVAKEMLRSGRPARDKSERMILNNFYTMQQIRAWKEQPLSKELIFEISGLVPQM